MQNCTTSALVILIACSSALVADVVHLKDGTDISGSVKRADDGWVITSAGNAKHLSADLVESIELNDDRSPGAAGAIERLASLRRSVANLTDLSEIIARFQRFIDQTTDATVSVDAKADLAIWKDRQQQQMVKAGSRWVSPTERLQLVNQASATIEVARQLMKQGRTEEAEPLLAQAMAIEPSNPSATFLTGLLRFQQDKIAAAKNAFASVAIIVPNHGPSLNNLGVIQWRQRQYVAALQSFDAAMLALPVDKIVLDNVAVAMETLPVNLQKTRLVAKALQHYREQDQQLAETMASQGLRRFGSIWVSDKDIADIRLQEKQIQDKLDSLAGQFDLSKQQIDSLGQTLSDDQIQIQRIESTSATIDPQTGFQVPIAYPSVYNQLQRDAARLQRDRDAAIARLDGMKKQAQDLENSKPGQKDRGVQRLIGVEGTPMNLGLNPVAIMPATQPTK